MSRNGCFGKWGVWFLLASVFLLVTWCKGDLWAQTDYVNSGTVSVSEVVGDNQSLYGVIAVDIGYSLDLFSNTDTGIISAYGEIGDDTSSGSIELAAVGGSYVWGNVDVFENEGSISAQAVGGDAIGGTSTWNDVYVYGVFGNDVVGSVSSFSNTGSIWADASVGDAYGYYTWALTYYVYGNYIGGTVDDFSNAGFIGAYASAGTDYSTGVGTGYLYFYAQTGAYDVYGAYFAGDVGSFSNEGTIAAVTSVLDAEAELSSAFSYSVYGVYFGGDVTDFSNTSSDTIEANVTVGNAAGLDSLVQINSVAAASFNGTTGNFANSGTIKTEVSAGGALGDGSVVLVYDISGVEFWGTLDSFTNEGEISVSVTVEDASGTYDASGVSSSISTFYSPWNAGTYGAYFDSDVDSFYNSGTILASVNGGSALGDGSSLWAAHVLGVDFAGNITGSFVNRGVIEASSVAGDAGGVLSDSEVFTVNSFWVDYDVNSFDNGGTLYSYGKVGEASGDYSYTALTDIGVGFLGNVGSFLNSGEITTTGVVGDVSGSGAYTEVGWPDWSPYPIYGLLFGGDVDSFVNKGSVVAGVDIEDVSGDYAALYSNWVVGAEFWGAVDSFENSGTFTTRVGLAQVSGFFADAEIYAVMGLEFDGPVTTFSNQGEVKSFLDVGDITGEPAFFYFDWLSGVEFWDSLGTFKNAGTVASYFELGNLVGGASEAYAYDLYGGYFELDVDSFENSGTISVSGRVGDVAGGYAYLSFDWMPGVEFDSLVTSFKNSGSISAQLGVGTLSGAGTTAEVYDIMGATFSGVSSFSNSGTISATAYVQDLTGDDAYLDLEEITGSQFWGNIGTFRNSGDIYAFASVGDLDGYGAKGIVWDVYGLDVIGYYANIDSLVNAGHIQALLSAGDVNGEGASLDLGGVYGLYFYGYGAAIGEVKNQGTISAFVTAGDVNGTGASLNVSQVYGTYLNYYNGLFVNTGVIEAMVKAGAGANVWDVAGLGVENGTGTYILNTGDSIHLTVLGKEGTSIEAAGIWVKNSPFVEISNPGAISLFSNLPDANVRTLWVENSYVSFEKDFSITFGCPGITKRPIYVDSLSTLDLNDASLIARAGRDLRFNYPYYVIENDGTVDGVFGGLKDGTDNPDIKPYWYGPDRGEDSAVIFKYEPRHSTAALSLQASRLAARNVMGQVVSHVLYDRLLWWVTEKERNRKVMLADSGQIATEAGPVMGGITSKVYKNGAFFYPFYSDVEADDLGYDAHGFGFAMGLERRIADYLSAGLFGGLSRVNVKYKERKYGGIEDKQDVYTLGLYVNLVPSPFYLGMVAMGYAVQHDYLGVTGPNLDIYETADYWSHGFEGEVIGGYMFGGNSWMVMPQVGLGYSYYRVSDYKTDAQYSNWDKYYESDSDGYVRLIAGLTGLKRWKATGVKVDLMGSFSVEQALGDNDISVTQSLPGLNSGKEDVEEEVGDTSVVGRLGLSVTVLERLKLNFSFRSEFNSDYRVYSGQASLGIAF